MGPYHAYVWIVAHDLVIVIAAWSKDDLEKAPSHALGYEVYRTSALVLLLVEEPLHSLLRCCSHPEPAVNESPALFRK